MVVIGFGDPVLQLVDWLQVLSALYHSGFKPHEGSDIVRRELEPGGFTWRRVPTFPRTDFCLYRN
jgi:hypothetical protein